MQPAPFSHISDAVRVLAPAVAIKGPVPRVLYGHRDWACIEGGPYAYASGTSYAVPLVGAYTLLIANNPDFTLDQGLRLLIGTTRSIEGSPAGQLDIAAALARGWQWREGNPAGRLAPSKDSEPPL